MADRNEFDRYRSDGRSAGSARHERGARDASRDGMDDDIPWSDEDAGYGDRSRRLYLDPSRRRIAGVCAGIARYYGIEPWVIRLLAVTALLFLPGIVFPAYWVAYFVMERPPGSHGDWRRRWHSHRDRAHRTRHRDTYSSPAPELGPRISPRRGLRDVQADLTEIELRLRRMEAHVTSGRYELQRELHKIDTGAAG
jgi:phage shock protein C